MRRKRRRHDRRTVLNTTMNPDTWKWIVALAIGSAIGVGLRRALLMLFSQSAGTLSVSMVTFSSLLGGFCGAAIAWVMGSPSFSKDTQTLLMFGMLGVMATIAADAVDAQASMSSTDLARLRRRTLVHIAVGIAAALIAIGLVAWVMDLASP